MVDAIINSVLMLMVDCHVWLGRQPMDRPSINAINGVVREEEEDEDEDEEDEEEEEGEEEREGNMQKYSKDTTAETRHAGVPSEDLFYCLCQWWLYWINHLAFIISVGCGCLCSSVKLVTTTKRR